MMIFQILVGLFSVLPTSIDTSSWTELPDFSEGGFGHALAINNDVAVVGAFTVDTNNITNTGAAYVFQKGVGDWLQSQKLIPSDLIENSQFGRHAIAIDNDLLVIGASTSNAAYIFKEGADGNWTEVAKLVPGDQGDEKQFGRSVAISGGTIAVGAYADADSGQNSGAVYIFDQGRIESEWNQTAKIVPSDTSNGMYFGIAVSLRDHELVVGSYREDEGAENAGATYAFQRNVSTRAWIESQKLVAYDGLLNDEFGKSVDFNDEWLAITSQLNDDGNRTDCGSLYMFHRASTLAKWTFHSKMLPDSVSSGDKFGYTVSIYNDYVAVGSRGYAAYLFQFDKHGDEWLELQFDKPVGSGDWFGMAVSIHQAQLLIKISDGAAIIPITTSSPTAQPTASPTPPTANPTIDPTKQPSVFPSKGKLFSKKMNSVKFDSL